jgi:hypothetical protein
MNLDVSSRWRRGRWLVLAVIGVTLAGDGIVISGKISALGLAASKGSILRWFLEAALLGAIWQGRNWARWLMAGLNGLALTIVVESLLAGGHPLEFAIGVQFAFSGAVLAFSPSVSAFLASQRAKYDT